MFQKNVSTPARSSVLCVFVLLPKAQSICDFNAFQNSAINTHALTGHKAVKDKITKC